MTTVIQRAFRVRLGVAALALVLGSFASLTFYRFGTTATDENIFADPVSPLYATAPVPAAETPGRVGGGSVAIEAGDLVVAVGDVRVGTAEDLPRAVQLAAKAPAVDVKVLRPTTHDTFVAAVDPRVLRAARFRDISDTVVVTAVTPRGASHRAGMQVGDVIVRINGQAFATALQADAIMRQAQVGRETAYEILRRNERLTLHVTLASFGFNLGLLALVLTGAVWMVLGTGLALVRPGIKAAVYLGVASLLLGYVLAVLAIRRDIQFTPFSLARDTLLITAFLVGVAVWNHADYYFPREHTALVRGWRVRAPYALAVLAAVLAVALRSNRALAVGMVALLSTVVAGQVRLRRERSPEERQIHRPVRAAKWAAGLVGAALVALNVYRGTGEGFWFGGLAVLLLIPAAHAYSILNYRLLDVDVRVRRSVQYSVASMAWTAVSVLVLLSLLARLPDLSPPLPNIRFTGASVEVLDTPLAPEERARIEKSILMVAAIGLTFLFRRVGRGGQQWIADKFHRTAYDYRRASGALAEIMSSRLDLDGLAEGLIETLVRLMPLKRAGVMFVHGSRTYCGTRARGFDEARWAAFCAASAADVVSACTRAQTEVNAEYVFPRLRRALDAAAIQYLYPIRAHDTLLGVVLVGEKLSEAAFEDDDFQFLGAVAHQVSAGVENAFLYEELAEQERMKHELDIARRIQLESLPQFTPQVDGLEVAGVSVPAFEVGGDYYDYLNGNPRELTVMVGDVSGKGTSAALYMSKLQGILRSLHAFNLTPRELFVRTNHLLCRDLERRSFVTAIGGFFHTSERRLVLARAGHLPMYHFDARRGEVARVLPRGLGFGLSSRHLFGDELEEREVSYGPGDVFLFITDGITECQAADGDDFGEERVMALLGELAPRGAPAATIRDRLLQAVRQFAPNVEQFDDQTVVVVRAVA